MHDEKDIIGHITANEVVDFNGNPISEDSEIPDKFNILTSAVVYTEWSDPEQRQRMHKIVSEIEDGKWFVSMECLFPSFDYALRGAAGETKVINYQVGRLLRNLSFSGKGLVSKPANPRSVILEGNDFFDESQAQVLTISSLKENDMSDDYEKQAVDLRAELAESKAANEALKGKVEAEQKAEFQEKIQALEATITEQASSISERVEAFTAKETELTEAQGALAA